MTKRNLVSFALALLLGMGWLPVQAARTFSATQTSPTPAPGQFDMGTTQSVTISVTNTSTGANVAERLYQVQFQLSTTACSPTPCTNTVFSSATTAPAGWTRTSFSSTSITFKANTFADALGSTAQSPSVPPTAASFTLVLAVGTFTADLSQTLSKVTARFSPNTNFSGSHAVNCSSGSCLGSWKAMSLQITSFQTTDTSGVSTSTIVSGVSFRVAITVKNISTVTQNGIVANPSPPTQTRGGTWVSLLTNCSLTSTSPSPFNLAAGASGTITYTCTTNAGDNGTVSFSVTDVRAGASVTSRTATSNSLVVSPLTITIATTPSCIFPGDTATFTMTVTNNTGVALNNVTPSALTRTTTPGAGAVTIGAFTGPTTNPLNCNTPSLANGATCNFIWTAPITGTVPASGTRPTFLVSGNVTANAGAITSQTASSPVKNLSDYLVAVSPASVNGNSGNQEIAWDVTNRGCGNNLNSMAITVAAAPAGWTYAGDSYSLVNNTVGSQVETWTVAATTFTAPSAMDRIPIDVDGNFSLVFSAIPSVAVATGSTFTVRVTDQSGFFVDRSTTITINPFGTGTANTATPSTWHEVFQ